MSRVAILASLIAHALSVNVSISSNLVPRMSGRIVGGRQTTIEEFPYQVSILQSRVHICGGSIYKPDSIITAAHCLNDAHIGDLLVVAGTTDWEYGGVAVKVKGFITHPRFVAKTFDFDIAILYLRTKLEYGPSIQPIQLPRYRQEFKPGSVGVVSGWGSLQENGEEPDYLQFTDLEIVGYYECYMSYKTIHPVTKNMLCAWHKAGGKGSCQGDSGSALVIGNVMAGIVSWGLGCARPGVPDVYTKVSTLRKWLDIHAISPK